MCILLLFVLLLLLLLLFLLLLLLIIQFITLIDLNKILFCINYTNFCVNNNIILLLFLLFSNFS